MGKHTEKQYYDTEGNLVIKPYRLKDLVVIFDVNVKTLKRWMAQYPQQLGERERNGKYYSVNQIEFMIGKFGLPKRICIQMFPVQNIAA